VGEFARGHCSDFSFDVVLDAADYWDTVVEKQIRGSGIAIEGLAHAAGVDHHDRGVPNERLVDVAVDGDRLAEG
jgi:hypothetical protein